MISITLGSLEMLPQAWHSQSTHAARTPTPEVLQKATDAGIGSAHVAPALMWLEQP